MATTARDVRKNYNVFVDGRGLAGQTEDFTPPKLALKTEEFRGGGMDAPVKLDMGQEAMEVTFTLLGAVPEVLKLWGATNGAETRLVVREALESFDGSVRPYIHTMAGRITELEQSTIKAGDKADIKLKVDLVYYRLEHGSQVLHEIDVVNMVRKVDGVDVLKAKRDALGI